jgi:chemotaxis protein CheX
MIATYDAELEQIVQTVFVTMLHLEVERIEFDAPVHDECITAAIRVAGSCAVEVNLILPREVAIHSAASMLGLSLDEVTYDDQVEVAAELANMIGGNLKSLLPSPSQLSIPTVKLQSSDRCLLPGDCPLWFVSADGPFAVRLSELSS